MPYGLIVGGTHDSMDEAPPVPMFGANRPRGRPSTGNLADALTDVADRLLMRFLRLPVEHITLLAISLLLTNQWNFGESTFNN